MPCGCHGREIVGAPLCPVGAMGAIAAMGRSYNFARPTSRSTVRQPRGNKLPLSARSP